MKTMCAAIAILFLGCSLPARAQIGPDAGNATSFTYHLKEVIYNSAKYGPTDGDMRIKLFACHSATQSFTVQVTTWDQSVNKYTHPQYLEIALNDTIVLGDLNDNDDGVLQLLSFNPDNDDSECSGEFERRIE